jgi:4-amino-4-deoxy-L-arabinose transferase-like glycosyltransferase
MSDTKLRRLAAIPVVLGLVLRVTYLLRVRRTVELIGDPYFYYHQAKALVRGQGFIHPFTLLTEHRVEQAADHPPLYPLLLAFFDKVGITSVTQQMFMNCLIGSASIVFAMVLARRISGPRTALVSGLFVAVNPNTFRYDGTLWSETLAIALMLLSILALHHLLTSPGWKWAAATGLGFGLATLTRAEYVIALPLITVFLVWTGRRSLRRSFAVVAIFAVAGTATMSPWLVYNATRFEHPVGLTVGFQYLLPLTNCDSTYYGTTIGYWDVECLQPAYQRTHVLGRDESIMASEATKDGLQYLRTHKRRALVMPFLRVGRLVGLYQPIQQANLDIFIEGVERPIALFGLGVWYALLLFGTIGAGSLRRKRNDLFALVLPGVVVTTASAVTYGTTRFRAGFEPFGCILAAIGLQYLMRLYRRIMGAPPSTSASSTSECQALSPSSPKPSDLASPVSVLDLAPSTSTENL